ncbi:alpha/beta fold hydrolase [Chitinophaga ginsengisoli]|uniref:Pimeloyl-ACP methyl ester carboxylesterase n=1 Tax=Chitinophaga ginsengisoli TaxID=363837 RepID=A0A2P8FQL1_9BACT|nr:alpha/beta hydrolase [Chitinophaga ginsengisoli]PSL24018.1 pimeloyl-ACP methyl ester carboxylesterase [Chitinophaga ginsengisoli]
MKHLILFAALALSIVSCKKDDTPGNGPETTIDYHQTATTQFVTAGDTKYAYRVLGDKEGIPLVMLSPLGSTMDDWDPAITNGLAQKYKVVIFDNQGVGSSTGKTPATIADMAKGAVTFIKALGYNKVNLMGFSMGGFITQQVALTEPGLLNKIVLTGTGPKGSEGLSNLPNILASAANLSPLDAFLYFGFTASAESKSAGKLSYERRLKRTVNRDAPVSDESGAAQLTAVLAWAQPYPDALKELEAITQPVLHIQGQKDMPVPAVNAINMSQHIPNDRLVLYPDAGHAAFFQYPDQFVQEVSEFLGK